MIAIQGVATIAAMGCLRTYKYVSLSVGSYCMIQLEVLNFSYTQLTTIIIIIIIM